MTSISQVTNLYSNSILVSSLFGSSSDSSGSDAISDIVSSYYNNTTDQAISEADDANEDIDIAEISEEALKAYQAEIDSVDLEYPSVATTNTLYSTLVGSGGSSSSSSGIYDSSDIINSYYS